MSGERAGKPGAASPKGAAAAVPAKAPARAKPKKPAGPGPVRRRLDAAGRAVARAEVTQRFVAWWMRFVFKWARHVGRERASRIAGRVARRIGPLSRENAIGRANLAAAFPEKSPEERERILSDVWDNLARMTMEYPFIQELVEAFDPERPTGGLIEHTGVENVFALRDSGKPGIIFGAHIGNWELTAAIGARLGLPVTALYRPPANRFIAAELETLRGTFIETLVVSGPGAAMRVASALQKGRHVGIVADQRINGGQRITFLGRTAATNPIVGIMARLFDCPVHGAYTVRLPDGRYHIRMTPALELPRDARGRVDPEATNRLVHGIIESWVRQNPEQWLWLHDRWRLRKQPKTAPTKGGGKPATA
ncbi:MAG TPA: lipid A biosynthesis lauroyl acyltransferase [Bauldia sp.]|nr:lipid A biosynthesis lauroyl acyltransferase [Bauldia sp.]